jgi:hypothetical protein
VSDGGICIDPTEHNYNSKIYPLYKDQEPYNCDNNINGIRMDSRYRIKDGYPVNEFYQHNGNLFTKLKSLPRWESSYYNRTSRVELYVRPYIGWQAKCTAQQNHPRNILWISQTLIDITDLQNELFYFHVIVLLSYILINLFVKWRLIKERIEFLYVFMLEAIYVGLCLIEVAISIVGINKFSAFYSACFSLKSSNCAEPTTTMIFGFLGETFYSISLHFYAITFFAVLSCFIYPLHSMYIYLQTSKVDAKELQTLVSK